MDLYGYLHLIYKHTKIENYEPDLIKITSSKKHTTQATIILVNKAPSHN